MSLIGVKLKPYLTQMQKIEKSLAEFSESGIKEFSKELEKRTQ